MAIDGRLNFDTKIDTKGFSSGVSTLSSQLNGLKSIITKLGAAIGVTFAVSQVVAFGKASVTAANNTVNAFSGLESILSGQGRSYNQATKWIQDYVSDGLIPLQNAVTAYKNLASRGYDDTQIQQVLTALKDSAAYGRQSSYTMGEAVQTATEGLKNENSILVDNAGVTKNVAKMWEDYAKSIGTTSAKLTQEQKIQAEVNGIMTETRFQTGDAAKVAGTFSGQLSRLTFNFNELKVALGNILTSVLKPVVTYLNAALEKITAYVKATANLLGFTNSLSGSSSSLADSSSNAADNYLDMAAAAEEAAEAQENSLASFDQINKLGDSSASSDTDTPFVGTFNNGNISTSVDIDISEANKKLSEFFKKIKKQFNDIFIPLKSAWDKNGSSVLETMEKAFKSVWSLIKSIGKSFKKIWTNGTGEKYASNILRLWQDIFDIIDDVAQVSKEAWDDNGAGEKLIQSIFDKWNNIYDLLHEVTRSYKKVWSNGTGKSILGNILQIWTNIETTIGNIANRLKTAWTADNLGTDIVQHAADIWNTILTYVEKITKKISDWSSTVDFEPLLKSFDDLELALQPFAETVGEGLEDFLDDVLLPLASWTIEDAIPTFLETLSKVIDGLKSVWDTAYPVVKEKLWDQFLKPIAEWAADKALTALSELGDIFKKMCDNVTEKDVEILLDLAGAIGSIYAAVKGKQKLDNFNNALNTMKTNAKNALTKVQQLWAAANAPIVTPKTTAIVPAGMVTQTGEAGTTAGLSFAAKFAAAVGAFFVGWNIGSMIRDAIGGDKIDEFLFPIFDAIVEFFTVKIPEWWDGLNADILFPLYDTAVAAWTSVASFFTETIPTFFSDFWSDLNEDILFPLYDTAVSAWNSIVTFFTETVPQDIEDNIVIPMTESFERAWEGIKEAWSDVKQWFSDRWNDITGIFSSVGSWFGEKFTIAWGGIQSAFSNVKTWFGDRWNDIKGVFSNIKKWFTDKFKGAWEGIKGVFSDVGEFFDGVWDSMTSGIKGAINTVIDGLNWMIDGINSISFEMPDWGWLPDGVQGATLGINIPNIPKLATGTVVPANYGEFMAILGDNKRETEIVSPLSTMKQALLEALVAYGGTNGNQKISVTIPISLNGKVISQLVIDDINDFIKRNGRSPLKI